MMKEICELLNELDASREKFFIDRRTKVNGVITLHTPQEEIETTRRDRKTFCETTSNFKQIGLQMPVCRANLSSSHKVERKF